MAQQQTSFYIATPVDPQSDGAIWGLGLTDEAAIADAYEQSNTHAPQISEVDGELPTWTVTLSGGDTRAFTDEGEAEACAAEHGFKALPCTERLYRWCEQYELKSWTRDAAGLEDLDVDQEMLDAAVAEVNEGFDGSTAQEDWKAETALQDAHDYVDAYVVDDETVDEDIRDALTDPQLRHAVDYAVRDVILDEIAERASA